MTRVKKFACLLMLVGAFFVMDSSASASNASTCGGNFPSECDCWADGGGEYMYCDFWPDEFGFNGAQICAEFYDVCPVNENCYWDRFTVYGICIAP